MAQIQFFGAVNQQFEFGLNSGYSSGLGMYGGAGFGASIPVGSYQSTIYITNAAGSANGPQCNSFTYLNAQSGIVSNVGPTLPLTGLPNIQATLNVRFTDSTPRLCQNVTLTIFDRVGNPPSGSPASGLVCAAYDCRHYDPSQGGAPGSGVSSWTVFQPTSPGTVLRPFSSPCRSGLSSGNLVDSQHDWYILLSASPTSIGAKSQFGLSWYLEYI